MGKRYNVVILPHDKEVRCEGGADVLSVLHDAGVGINSACGGEGTCGGCQVEVREADFEVDARAEVNGKKGRFLACQLTVEGDLTVYVPPESRVTRQQILLDSSEKQDDDLLTQHRPSLQEVEKSPLVKSERVQLEPPSLQDNTSDTDRLRRHLKQLGRDGKVVFSHSSLSELADVLRDNDWHVDVNLTEMDGFSEITRVSPPTDAADYGLAVDVGTTTVAAQLVDLDAGDPVLSMGAYNQQGRFGDDVISRINYASSHDEGIDQLQEALICTVNELTDKMSSEVGIVPEDIQMMVCAGNTTMIHTLCGIDPNNIRRDPYIPTFSAPPALSAEQLGLNVHPAARVFAFPAVGSFVGGDVVSGVLASGLHKSAEMTLYIDIGTNGELVVGNQDLLMACSASAGPAFEGGGITWGMRAMDGAIQEVKIDPDTLVVRCQTINNLAPVGICGTGLIDLLATMQKSGIINRSGKFNEDLEHPRLRDSEEGLEFVLVWAEHAGVDDDIVITSGDIKNLMRSKAAIYAGVQMLLKNLSMEPSFIQRVLIAGGFGNFLDLEAAIHIGMFPDIPRDRFKFIGNGALIGASQAVISADALRQGEELASGMTYLELSSKEQAGEFMDEFVAAQFIPHTDLDAFPTAADNGMKNNARKDGDANE